MCVSPEGECPSTRVHRICAADVGQDVTSMEVRIRQAVADEAPALAALQRRTDLFAYASIFPPEAPQPDLDRMTLDWQRRLRDMHAPNARRYRADIRNLPAGVIIACGDPDDPKLGYITRLYVDPQEWGRGIGRSLYDDALSYLRSIGYVQASLWVLERNERARSWYERLGWSCTGERKSVLDSAGVEDLRYTRPL